MVHRAHSHPHTDNHTHPDNHANPNSHGDAGTHGDPDEHANLQRDAEPIGHTHGYPRRICPVSAAGGETVDRPVDVIWAREWD